MFKNELALTQTYLLSKKEKKELLKKLGIYYNTDCVKYLQDNFNGNFSSNKVTIGNNKRRIIIYENNPIFFEYDNDTFYPTVYLLNQFPELINKFALIYEDTDTFLANGADLMLKGVLNREDIKKNVPFKLNDLFVVITLKGVVTSVGQALMSTMTMNVNQPSGKFMKILHRINDGLFLMGSKKMPERIELKKNIVEAVAVDEKPNGNEGVIIEEVNTKTNMNSKINDKKDKISKNENNNIEINNEINISATNELPDQENNEEEDEEYEEEEYEEGEYEEEEEEFDNNKIEDNKINENLLPVNKISEINQTQTESEKTNDDTNKSIIPKIPIEENDKNIELIFLHLIKLYLKDNKEILPLDPGKLLKVFMMPCSIELNLPFDMKTSSFKKINSFLKSLQKDKNLIQFGKPKGQQNDYLLSVYWEHPMIQDFVPRVKNLAFIDKLNNPDEDDKANVILQKDEKIEVTQLFKPNQKIKLIFEKTDKKFNNSNYYSLKHCNEILTAYLKEKDLFLKAGNVRMDVELKNALFKYEKDANANITETIKMDDLLLRWKSNLNEKSFITKTGANNEHTVLTNNGLKVRINARKIANKNVTIIDGLQNFVNVKDVIKIFSKHFACAVTLKDFQSSKDAIFIQGYWVSELVTLLQEEIKLKKEFIVVEDKLNLKSKKKK